MSTVQVSRGAIVVLCTGFLMLTSVGITSFSIFLPWIEQEFGLSRSLATVPYFFGMVAWGISAPTFGKLADDYGSRPVILGGIMLMAAGFLVMGVSQNLLDLSIAFGLMVGLAMGACTLSLVSLLVSKHFDVGNRGLAVSVVQTASPLNPMIVAPFLFLLITTVNWRAAALATAALLLFVALPLAWFGAREPESARVGSRQKLGWNACLPYLRDRSMILLFIARLSCGLAFFQIAHLVALTISKGFDVTTGAYAVSVFGISAAACALLFGWLADRYGRARVLGLSYLVRGIGTLALAFAIPSDWLWYLLVALAIGPTFGTVAVNNVMFFEAVGPRLAGVVLGLSFVVHQVGSAVGPLVGALVYDATATYDGFLVVMALILLASGAITYNLGTPNTRQPEQLVATAPSGA